MNMLNLAYLGDSVYEVYIRKYLVTKINKKNCELQKLSLNFVSARSQRKHFEYLENNNLLTDDELDIIRRGRNTKGGKCKSADIVTYRIATGFECLFGQLYLDNNIERIEELISLIIGE